MTNPDSHESVPVLSAEEEAWYRAHPMVPKIATRIAVGRLLATLDAERKASAARIEQLETVLAISNDIREGEDMLRRQAATYHAGLTRLRSAVRAFLMSEAGAPRRRTRAVLSVECDRAKRTLSATPASSDAEPTPAFISDSLAAPYQSRTVFAFPDGTTGPGSWDPKTGIIVKAASSEPALSSHPEETP